MAYVSSIITKYGDTKKVSQDVKTINEIIYRQGYSLLIDLIAEFIGEQNLKYKWDSVERMRVEDHVAESVREAIQERT